MNLRNKMLWAGVWVGKPEKRLIKLQMPTDKYIFNLYKTLFNV